MVICLCLVFACLFDYRWQRIPNALILFMLLIRLSATCWRLPFWGTGTGIAQMVTVFVLLYPFFKIGVLGAGDVKLFAVCAGFLPFCKIFLFLFFSLLFAAVFSLFQLLIRRDFFPGFYRFYRYITRLLMAQRFLFYFDDAKERKSASICLTGPMLCSVLLYWKGMY